MTLTELAAVVGAPPPAAGGRAVGPGVCIDSRRTTPGALFVAYEGESVDGHDYIAAAFAAGAAAAMGTRLPADLAPEQAAACLQVDDPTRALSALAHHVVTTAHGLNVVGVTGSAGKTSTKDLIAQVLEADGPTIAPPGSFNNEIGLPLTATGVGADTRHLVAEMGARGIGHIAHLCGITPPTVGVVLNVGQAHLGEFGSQERIAQAKGELVEALPADGWAVLNARDAFVAAMASRTQAHLAFFSAHGRPDVAGEILVWADAVTADDVERYSFELHAERDGVASSAPVRLQFTGRHQVANATAAAAAALASGMELADIAHALSAATARSRWRMEIHEPAGGPVVINDAYNANPDSMIAALNALAAMGRNRRRTHPGCQTWAVLGQMYELGETAAAEHEAIGRAVGSLQVDHLIALGENAPDMVAAAIAAGCEDARVATDIAQATQWLTAGAEDVLIVKGSRAVGLERVADAVLAMVGHDPAQAPQNPATAKDAQ